MSDLSKHLGKKIKEMRKAKQLTQNELAEKVNIDAKYLSRIETGLSYPSLKTIEKFVSVLNTDVSCLFDFSEYKSREFMLKELMSKLENYSTNKIKFLLSVSNVIDTKNL